MKVCPRCQKTYQDDNLNFCLEDGAVLTQTVGGQAMPDTVLINQARATSQPVQPSAPQGGWNVTPQQPQPQYSMQPQKKSSKVWVWVLLILGAVVLLCGGGLAGLVYIGSQVDTNSSSSNISVNRTANKGTSNSTTTSSSSDRDDVTELNFDMFVQKFSIYGTTEVEGDELMVKAASSIAYYVLAAPSDYSDENSDTRLTLRNTTGEASTRGYGMVFHSNPTPLQQGYAFLIDAKRQRYTVVRHTPGKENTVIKWTDSTDIIVGTAENTLEIRDRGKTVDLYINGTKVNSITNEHGYAGGVPGLYVGQGVKVAFKDFEIRK